MKLSINKSIGMLVLCAWLILTGLMAFIPALGALGIVMPILAIIAGVLILLGR